jgi:hypothetical protein
MNSADYTKKQSARDAEYEREYPKPTDNSKIASYMAKDVPVTGHGKEILEGGDRKKRQAAAEKIAGSGDVRCWNDTCESRSANRRELGGVGPGATPQTRFGSCFQSLLSTGRLGVLCKIEQIEHDAHVTAVPPLMILEANHNAVVRLKVVGDVVGGLNGALSHLFVAGGL